MFYDQEILDEFKVEATELLCSAEEDILEMEDRHDDKELVNRIFRAFHTVKGNASMIGYDLFASLAHHAEDILTKVRSGVLVPTKKMVDLLLNVVDTLKILLDQAISGEASAIDISELIGQLQGVVAGMTVTIDLEGVNETASMEMNTASVGEPGNLRILAAEDDFTSREILRLMLSDYGIVHEVENGLQVVEAFKATFEKKPITPYQLVCLDIMMPELDGMEAAMKIRTLERENGVPQRDEAVIIMITALDDPKTVLRSLYKCGATSYLVKPVNRTALEKELRKLMLI